MKKSFGVFVVALVASLSFAGIAVASDSEEPAESTLVTPQIIVDEETGTIYVGLPSEGEMPECGPEDPDDGEVSGDADGEEPGEVEEPEDGEATIYGPGDCIEFVIDHPSGKSHHGAVVSTVAKNLHPSMLNGIKKGEIMRYVAKTGKVDDADGEAKPKVKAEKPEKVKKDKKDKKDKPEKVKKDKKDKPDKGNKGNARAKTKGGRHNR